MSRRSLAGKVVVISGGAGGLGMALGRAFGAAGARIALLDLNGPAAAAAARTLSEQQIDAAGFACDVTDEASCRRALAEARTTCGPVDVLVANAGITHRSAFKHTTPSVIRRVVEVNLFGAVHCTHAALPDLLQTRGMIVAISSVAGFGPLVARTGYAASKHALHGFYDSLRSELAADGVGVLLVCPSFIDTKIAHNALGGDGGRAAQPPAAVGRRTTPDEVAIQIVQAVRDDRQLLLPDRVSKLSWLLSRAAPRFYARQMAKRLAAELVDS